MLNAHLLKLISHYQGPILKFQKQLGLVLYCVCINARNRISDGKKLFEKTCSLKKDMLT